MASLYQINGTGGPTLLFSGGLSEDKYGLSTGSARWWALTETAISRIALIGSSHPTYSSLQCERRSITQAEAGFYLDAYYSGLIGTPTPVYEMDTATTNSPIETHPNFLTFAGSLGAEVNGALFNDDGSFNKFGNDAPEEWRGVTSYEMPVVIYRKTYVTTTEPTTEAAQVGTITTPSGAPGITGNWLLTGVSTDKRGRVFVVRMEWKASGLRGWNATIY